MIISIKNELDTLGLMYIFEGNFVYENNVFFIIKSRFNDVYQQNMLSRIQNTTRGALYKHLVDNFTIQFYLQKSLNRVQVKTYQCQNVPNFGQNVPSPPKRTQPFGQNVHVPNKCFSYLSCL